MTAIEPLSNEDPKPDNVNKESESSLNLEVNFPVFPELSAEMELGCSVFLQEEEDNKDNVLAAKKNTSDSSEQTLINQLTNIFKTPDNQPAPNLRKISDDDIGIVEMGGSFYCSGCDFVVNTILAARKHLASTHSGIREESNPDQDHKQTKPKARSGVRESNADQDEAGTRADKGLLKCQLCTKTYPQACFKDTNLFTSTYL